MASQLWIETGWPSPTLNPNSRANRWDLAKARRKARADGFIATLAALAGNPWKMPQGRVKLTIHAHPPVRRRRDDDNLTASAKPYRDGIAQRLGIDDSRFDAQPVHWHEPAPPRGALFFHLESTP